jgi:predicted AlkP superfamily pyrophosphatase or phosphodiesterase
LIVIDQFRADYLDRFAKHFGSGGFNLLLARGARLTEARYDHVPTVTCAGHATIATGSPPALTGIVGNEWWNAAERRVEYCARDDAAPLVGDPSEGRSPRNLIGATIGDMLKLSNRGASRVIAVAGKDRAAIMLGGHLADAAYWLAGTQFVTSTYYRRDLPGWAASVNSAKPVEQYFGKTWDRALPTEAYASLGPDDDPAEVAKPGVGRTFPHLIGAGLAKDDPALIEAFETSPFENEVIVDFAIAAVRNERLGRGAATDLLALGLSANDHIGHAFGPDSQEVLDATVRTDRLLARFFAFLDQQIGLANVVIVLSADHGVAPVPELVNRLNPRSGAERIDPTTIARAAEAALVQRFGRRDDGRSWVVFHEAPYLYLDERELAARHLAVADAEAAARDALAAVPGVFAAYSRTELRAAQTAGGASDVLAGFNAARSGNVLYLTAPFVIEDSEQAGTTHGSPWSYDERVPMLWYGAAIAPGAYGTAAVVRDLAPTLARILGVEPPTGATGRVLTEVLRLR